MLIEDEVIEPARCDHREESVAVLRTGLLQHLPEALQLALQHGRVLGLQLAGRHDHHGPVGGRAGLVAGSVGLFVVFGEALPLARLEDGRPELARLALAVLDAVQPLGVIGIGAQPAELPVTERVDADVDLLLDGLAHRLLEQAGIGGLVIGLAAGLLPLLGLEALIAG